MKTKTFDCVEMKRQAASRIYKETQGMTLEERQAYWRKKHAAFIDRQEERKQAMAQAAKKT